jgi:hypothetical protein
MSHTLENQQKIISITTGNLNSPMNNIINRNGQWYYYVPLDANNSTIPSSIVPYQWSTVLPLVGAGDGLLQMEGTVPLLREVWNGANVFYHAAVNEPIGPGINDITATQENDAFFFSHLSALSANTTDLNAFYWDRAFQATDNLAGDWDYYQYHAHLPTNYPQYEAGRLTTSGGLYVEPTDKAFGYMIHTRVRVSATNYQSVMARIHTPSVGGAHNSHNDVTLPTAANKNYIMGGIIKGVGNRYHCFYFTANGAQWTVFNRTYVHTSASFTSQVELGTFDLADPTFSFGTDLYNYPIRVSCGDTFGQRIYFPVIMNNATSGFDLEIWSFNSNDTIAGGSLVRTVLLSGVTARPDCMLLTVGTSLHAAVTDVANGGISFYTTENGTTWEASTNQIVTNGSAQPLRIHGLRYNQQDVNYYLLLSGTSTSTGTYSGPGLYTFNIQADFLGYDHLDYDHTTNSFVNRGPLSNGHLTLTKSTGVITKSNLQEPEGIASTINVLNYTSGPQAIFNKKELDLQGDEYIYQGIILHDGRKLLAGRVENLKYRTYNTSSLLAIVNSQDSETNYSFAYDTITGDAVDPARQIVGDNYITSLYQSHVDENKIWFTGYCKSEFVPKKDMNIHGYCRNLTSGGLDQLEWNALSIDSSGNIYAAGFDDGGSALIAKYTANYIIQWKKELVVSGFNTQAYGIAIDSSDNVYVVGTLYDPNTPGSARSAFVSKYNSDGTQLWTKTYTNGSDITEGKSICVIQSGTTDYIVISTVIGASSPFDTTIVVLDTDGTIYLQSLIQDISITKVKDNGTDDGRFIFVGVDHTSTDAIFGMADIDSATTLKWTSTYNAGGANITFNDIARASSGVYIVTGSKSTSGLVLRANVSEVAGVFTVTKGWARTLATSSFASVTADSTKVYCVGTATAGGTGAMGMNEGVVASYNVSDGTINWRNVFGHDMDEAFTNVVFDITTKNVIVSGWSESHSFSRDAIIFRLSTNGFGTGVYHILGNAGVPYYYEPTSLVDASETSSLSTFTLPTETAGNRSASSATTFTYTNSTATSNIFDGSYGGDGVFMLIFGYIDLTKVAEFLNSDEYKENVAAGKRVNYTDSIWTFWQVATVGDGSADDGNVFGYDIIETADGSAVYIIGQTSGNIAKTNTGASGVYDYILIKFDPITEDIEYYQNGSDLDEETYALTELSNGKIAFCGRTTGDLGNTNLGGYDLFLGIYNPADDTFVYRSTGSGLDDRALNVHDMGANTLAVVYGTYGDFGGTNLGPQDVGVAFFNYSTNTWGNAYLTGTTAADLFDQNGKPSVKLDNGTIAIGFSTAGIYNTDVGAQGFLDIAIAIFFPDTNTFFKGQVGSQASEILTSVDVKGERGIFTGYITGTFGEGVQGILGEGDVVTAIGAKSSSA